MGDSGSYFLGFVLSAITIQGSQKSATMVSIAVPILILGIPIIETLVTITRRFLDGKPLFSPDQEHMHHKLLKLVRTQRFAVLILYGVTAFFGLSSFLVVISSDTFVATLSLGAGIVAVWGLRKLGYVELEELWDYGSRALRFQRRIITNQIFIRKAANRLDNAYSFERMVSILAETFASLNFDCAEIVITKSHGHADDYFRWSWYQNNLEYMHSQCNGAGHQWKIVIPIGEESIAFGYLTLSRSLDKDGLPFQISSIVNMFAGKLTDKILLFSRKDYDERFEMAALIPAESLTLYKSK